jgi:hypothetical protein
MIKGILEMMKVKSAFGKGLLCLVIMLNVFAQANAWGFYGHRLINRMSVYLLPPEMMVLYKPNIEFLAEHAVDPDKRRYVVNGEAPRHYIDLDRYGIYPYPEMPREWNLAVAKWTEDTLQAHGIVPWWTQTMLRRLTDAFAAKDQLRILRLSADIGHYIGDAHVPLHACSNYNGAQTDQVGIHGFWESRIPELFAESEYDFFIGKAGYIEKPGDFIWNRVLESAAAADTVLKSEAVLNARFSPDRKYAYEERLGKIIRQYSSAYSKAYSDMLNGMIERRMRQTIFAVASFWYTAWVNAGQPDLRNLTNRNMTEQEQKEYEELNKQWQTGKAIGKICE